jgi:hypothetical protein
MERSRRNRFVADYDYPCDFEAHQGGQFVIRPYVDWNSLGPVIAGHSFKQYAYMVVQTGALYDSRNTNCAVRAWPQRTGESGCSH